MDRMRLVGWHLALVLCIAAFAVGASRAAASPQDVIADWNLHGEIDGDYSITDLYNAKRLMLVQDPQRASDFARLADEKIEKEFLGIDPQRDPAVSANPSVPAADLPAWVPFVAAVALLVGAGGIASAVYRRRRQGGA